MMSHRRIPCHAHHHFSQTQSDDYSRMFMLLLPPPPPPFHLLLIAWWIDPCEYVLGFNLCNKLDCHSSIELAKQMAYTNMWNWRLQFVRSAFQSNNFITYCCFNTISESYRFSIILCRVQWRHLCCRCVIDWRNKSVFIFQSHTHAHKRCECVALMNNSVASAATMAAPKMSMCRLTSGILCNHRLMRKKSSAQRSASKYNIHMICIHFSKYG